MLIDPSLVEVVGDLLRRTADQVIRPRFRQLLDGEVVEKSPGEVVTVADREAEDRITEGLARIGPSLPVVGEEAAAADPSMIEVLHRGESCWVLDPLDGTANFVAGSPNYGVQLALVEDGATTAAWVFQPESGTLWTAQRGRGTWRQGPSGAPVAVRVSGAPAQLDALKAAVFTRFMTEADRDWYDSRPLPQGNPSKASAIDYPAIVLGDLDLVVWSRILPWDHLPGALLLTEAGGHVSRLDGSAYAATSAASGLVAARSTAVWALAQQHWA